MPPQRLDGESKRRYLKVLDDKIEAWRKIRDDEHNKHDLRRKARHRHTVCVQARDRTIAGRD